MPTPPRPDRQCWLVAVSQIVTRDEPDSPADSAQSAVPGLITGGGPWRVLLLLRARNGFVTERDVREALGMEHPSACWALLALRRRGLIDCVPDTARNARYLRYRAKRHEQV